MADVFISLIWAGGIATAPRSDGLLGRIFWPIMLGRWLAGVVAEALIAREAAKGARPNG